MFKFIIKLVKLLFLLAFAFGLCFLLSLLFGFWSSYGYFPDTLWHYILAHFVSQYFPHINWFYRWGGGVPVIFTYPPYLNILEAGLRAVTNWDMQVIAFWLIFGGIFLAGFWSALAVWLATESWLLALASLPFIYGAPMLWQNKNVARGATYHLLSLAVLSLVWYWQKPSKRRKILLIICLGICSLFHPIIGLFVLATAFCFLLKDLKELFSVMLPVGIIAATYFLPLKIFSGGHSRFFFRQAIIPFSTSLQALAYLDLSPASFLVAAFSILIMIIFARKNLQGYRRIIFQGASLCSFGLLVYFFGVYFRLPSFFYISGLPHDVICIYLIPFLALLTGISLKTLTQNKPRAVLWLVAGISLSLLLSASLYPHRNKLPEFKTLKPIYETPDYTKLEKLFGPPPGENDYRFVAYFPADCSADFLQIRYDTPNFGRSENRALGARWFGLTMASLAKKGQEKYFFADWFGLHYVFELNGLPPETDIFDNKEAFTVKTYNEDGNPFGGYFNQPKPIIEASSAPSVLFIGTDIFYDRWIDNLALLNINSSLLIPVKGPEKIAKISQAELNKFDVVWLYRYQYGSKKSDLAKLTKFVKNGGGLVIDTGFGPDQKADNLAEPFPISKTYVFEVNNDWQNQPENHPINQEINFADFSPPVYNDGKQEFPWKISTTNDDEIKPWAKTILSTQGKPLVVAGKLGEGKVVWTGLNLPYHLERYGNQEELRFLIKMILWPVKDKLERPQFSSQFINPEKRTVEIGSPARGVIFREQFFTDWQARVGQKKQEIYNAGPSLMYLAFDKSQTSPTSVIFYYEKSLLEKGTLAAAILLILVLLVAFFKKKFLNDFLLPQGSLTSAIKKILHINAEAEENE